jgi:hypothetical protein
MDHVSWRMSMTEGLARELAALSDDELAKLTAEMSDDEYDVVVGIIGGEGGDLARRIGRGGGESWRLTPTTMANYLTGGKLKRWPYAMLLGRKFADAVEGRSTRQIWNMPPRYGKSLYASQWGPAWALDRDPSYQMILASYGDTLALENAHKLRSLLVDYRDHLRVDLRPDRRAAKRFVTSAGGGILASGLLSGITGFPANGLVLDDPFKNWQEAHSAARRDAVENEFRAVVASRMEWEDSWVIVPMTRWHEDDICGRLIKHAEDETGEAWEMVRIPELCDDPDNDPLGRALGEVIETQRFSKRAIARKHLTAGTYLTASMYQQRPAPEEGGELKRAWWRLESSMPPHYDVAVSSWDLKLKDNETGDFVVGQVWGRTGKDMWMVDQLRGQWNQATAESAIALMSIRHPYLRAHYIEKAGNGPEVIAALTSQHPDYELSDDIFSQLGMTLEERIKVTALRRRGMGGIMGVTVKGTKSARMRAVSGYIEAGDVHLPERASWLGTFMDECVTLDTVIFTRQGLVPAEEVQVGDQVLTHRGRFRPVLAVRRRHAPDTVEVTAKALDPLVVTPDHPVLSMRLANATAPGGSHAQGLEWRPAGELSPRTFRRSARGTTEPSPNASDALTFPVLDEDYELDEIDLRAWYDYPGEPKPRTRRITATDDGEFLRLNLARAQPLRYRQLLDHRFGRLCGLWLAEGSYSTGHAQWSFNTAETTLIAEVQATLLERLGLTSSTFSPGHTPNATIVTASQPRLARWWRSFGQRAPGKRIPEWAWAAPRGFHQGMVEGWLDGDGFGQRGVTTSIHLAWGMRLLATRSGLWPKLTRNKLRLPKDGNRITPRHVSYTLDMAAKSKVTEVWTDDDGDRLLGFWVRSVATAGPADVVNFHVDEDESYVTTGGTVHNCAAFPNGAFDDQVDAASQALARLLRQGVRASSHVPGGVLPRTPTNTRPAGGGAPTMAPAARAAPSQRNARVLNPARSTLPRTPTSSGR